MTFFFDTVDVVQQVIGSKSSGQLASSDSAGLMWPSAEWVLARLYTASMYSKMSSAASSRVALFLIA